MPDGFLDFFFATFWRFFTVFWHFLVVFCHFLPLFSSNFPLGISVRNFRTDMPNVKFVIFCQNWPKPWSSMFGGRYLRQRTALGSESTAPQTETTLGLPTGQKRRICGKNVINLLIFWVFSHFSGQKFAGRSVADPRYFFVFFFSLFLLFFSLWLTCSEIPVIHWFFQAHNPTHAERTSLPGKKKEKKKTNRQTEAKSHAIVTTR